MGGATILVLMSRDPLITNINYTTHVHTHTHTQTHTHTHLLFHLLNMLLFFFLPCANSGFVVGLQDEGERTVPPLYHFTHAP